MEKVIKKLAAAPAESKEREALLKRSREIGVFLEHWGKRFDQFMLVAGGMEQMQMAKEAAKRGVESWKGVTQ